MRGAQLGAERERDRYGRKSWREQLGEVAGWFPAHKKIVAFLILLVPVLIAWRLITPQPVKLADFRAGDCLYLHTDTVGMPGDPYPAGRPDYVAAVLVSTGAERAACDGLHGQEVTRLVAFSDPSGTAYPGSTALIGRVDPVCYTTEQQYLAAGSSSPASDFTTYLVVPDAASWEAGQRTGACILQRADGQLLHKRAGAPGA